MGRVLKKIYIKKKEGWNEFSLSSLSSEEDNKGLSSVKTLSELKTLDTSKYKDGDIVIVTDEKMEYRLDTSLEEDSTLGKWRSISGIINQGSFALDDTSKYSENSLYKTNDGYITVRSSYSFASGVDGYFADTYLVYYGNGVKTTVNYSDLITTISSSVPSYLVSDDNGLLKRVLIKDTNSQYYFKLIFLPYDGLYYKKTSSTLNQVIDAHSLNIYSEQVQAIVSQKVSSLFTAVEVSSISEISKIGTYSYTGAIGDYDGTWMVSVKIIGTTKIYEAILSTDLDRSYVSNEGNNWTYTGSLFMHTIHIYKTTDSAQSPLSIITLINSSKDAYTKDTFKTYLVDNGHNSEAASLQTGGITSSAARYVSTTSGGSVTTKANISAVSTGIYVNSSDNIRVGSNWGGSLNITNDPYGISDHVYKVK